ncbi:T9SS type A sorting domain-containing protein [Chryseobacterium sp. SSA4.19]|uniref:T9SS type A sorting domain-containing protein n=1 Tax=Chryseobacterium sp. SSA4.19 TaxID=2919915 RepID=UPI001F4E64C2|nr:T9SS type A sorting domain-containing protein [Chryseobacterium sp. SSA4.19]MCJ8152180.1 T9SS type A sorting domain-containing protein [Chryseobacterium sp. SSA4.19]
MKKIYSLLAAAVFSTTAFGQGSENFEAQTALTSSYANGSFAGQTSGVTVNYVHSRDEGSGTSDNYSINGKGILLRRSDEPSSVEFVIPNGVGTFTFKYRKAFTAGTNNRVLAVFINGIQTTVIPAFGAAGADPTVYTSNTTVNTSGPVTIRISYPTGTASGNKQITIDDVSWTAAGTLAVSDLAGKKGSFVKNTFVTTEQISFGAPVKDVKIYNMVGQIVKTASVKENESLNIAELQKGNYIVTGIVNNKPVSEKILKD